MPIARVSGRVRVCAVVAVKAAVKLMLTGEPELQPSCAASSPGYAAGRRSCLRPAPPALRRRATTRGAARGQGNASGGGSAGTGMERAPSPTAGP
jgi:hypothetical protein